MRNETQDACPQMEIIPFATLVDEPVRIRATGFPAEHPVLLRAHLPTKFGRLESFAPFQTDGTGCIDVARAVPLRGTYGIADPMGLFWSMTKVESTSSAVSPGLLGTVTLTAEVEGKVEASASCQRSWYGASDITSVSVRERGLVGTFSHPRGSGPFPAVIVLGGGEGGLDVQECFAALLATHGYATLGLAYSAWNSSLLTWQRSPWTMVKPLSSGSRPRRACKTPTSASSADRQVGNWRY